MLIIQRILNKNKYTKDNKIGKQNVKIDIITLLKYVSKSNTMREVENVF